jgi:hypothetical protein
MRCSSSAPVTQGLLTFRRVSNGVMKTAQCSVKMDIGTSRAFIGCGKGRNTILDPSLLRTRHSRGAMPLHSPLRCSCDFRKSRNYSTIHHYSPLDGLDATAHVIPSLGAGFAPSSSSSLIDWKLVLEKAQDDCVLVSSGA